MIRNLPNCKKFIIISITIILLAATISVEVNSGEYSFGSDNSRMSPLPKLSKPSNSFIEDGDIKEVIEHTPITFTENRGQLENDEVRFYTQSGNVWFTDDGVWFELREYDETRSQESQTHTPPHSPTPKLPHSYTPTLPHSQTPTQKYKRVILKQEFVGANRVRPVGRERLTWNSNFFYGNVSSKWCTGVPNYKEVYFENLYDGIDLKYYSNENGLKYDFIVHPGADVGQIIVNYIGAEKVEIDKLGNIVIKTKIQNIKDCNLFIYQNYEGKQNEIDGKYVKLSDFKYGFKILSKYNMQESLIIDPVLDFSTYVGGSTNDWTYGIAVDSVGDAFVSGYTYSTNFPTTPGAHDRSINSWDIFVFKLSSNGSALNYSTFIGGFHFDYSFDITVDTNGNAYVTGTTRSTDFPITSGAYDNSHSSWGYDAFITKLNSTGSGLLYSTYIHGFSYSPGDYGQSIKVDSNGNIYLTGYTDASDFPTSTNAFDSSHNGVIDVFVVKLKPAGLGSSDLLYSTYVGGSENDYGYDITIDSEGYAYVTGKTRSLNFPNSTGAYDKAYNGLDDVFVFKLNQNGSNLEFSTYIGKNENDIGNGIAIDLNGNPIITGSTNSPNFPNTTGAYDNSYNGKQDIFLLKLNQTGSKLIYSTFIGGAENDIGNDIALDYVGNIYVTGETGSANFPTTPNTYDSIQNGTDVFFIQLSPNGDKLLYSTYIGGDNSDYGQGVTPDLKGNILLTGDTYSSNFPTTPGAYDRSFNSMTNSYSDSFVVKFSGKPYINITFASLLINNTQTKVIYSKLCPYTFRITVIDTENVTDLTSVLLTLDPLGNDVRLLWYSVTGKFTKSSDPKNYVTIDESSQAKNYGYMWIIDFNVIFNWNYPDENFHKIQAKATSKSFSPTWYNRSKFYRVENDLLFNGTLTVTDEDNRTIQNYDLIRGGEQLLWGGLTVVYENTTDVFPPDEEFNITIEDEHGNSWTVSPASGNILFMEISADKKTDLDGNNHTISISEIPHDCDKSNEYLIVQIDGDNVSFYNEFPDSKTWQKTKHVLVGVNITDVGGGEVDVNSVKYQLSINNGSTWDEWKSISGLSPGVTINVKDTVSLIEGKDNLIKWNASDTVGNGPTESKQFRILVDTEDVTFSNAWPSTSDISTTDEVEVGITISDKTSGVDASSIQYSVSENKGETWEPWEFVEDFEDGANVVAHINLTFPNGTDNVLKWRAFDIADNGPTESPWQIINVNTWVPLVKPEVILLSPPNGVTINKTTVNFSWELKDKTVENVTYNLFIDNETSPKFMVTDIENTNYVIEDLKDGETYYWRVIPILDDVEGVCISGSWWFKIDLSKAEKEKIYKVKITGRDSISLFPGENKSISLSITNLGESKDMIKLELEGGKLSDYIYFEDYSLLELESNNYALRNLIIELPLTIKPGNHVIMISAISMNSGEIVKVTHVIEIEIKELDDTKPDGEPNGTKDNDTTGDITKEKTSGWSDEIILFSAVAIVILIILFLALALFINKRKKRAGEELLAPGTFAIKPGALPSPVITMEQVGGAPTVQQLPGTAAAGVTTQPTAVTAPVPTLAATTTATPAPPPEQIPQVPQLPQLPPAQIQTEPLAREQATPTSTVVTPTPTLATTTPTPLTPTPTIAPSPSISQPPNTPTPGPSVHLPDLTPQPTNVPSVQTPKLKDNTTDTPQVIRVASEETQVPIQQPSSTESSEPVEARTKKLVNENDK